MSAARKSISPDDILDMKTYEGERDDRRAHLRDIKRDRRVEVGPCATFYFENYDTMLHQIHEMLRIEGGGAEQMKDELDAYNPLIPQGRDLVATLMFEIDDEVRRDRMLRQLSHVEETCYLQVGDQKVMARAEDDVERTKDDGKTSSIHFLHFDLSDAQAESFKNGDIVVSVGIGHENYAHAAGLNKSVRSALSGDLD
ncbi:DUF3501 family protein [Parvibaculaceae bacterium PLY_AMNH_Bact1]|nr:DUF3501 family protein [Parvibaculaceae bacterium PLY_AMNH_Bact1]